MENGAYWFEIIITIIFELVLAQFKLHNSHVITKMIISLIKP